MTDISAELKQFIDTQIESVDQLRVLLLLATGQHTDWAVDRVAGKLSLTIEAATEQLGKLRAKGLLSTSTGAKPTFRYSPINAPLRDLVAALATLDRERPVTLINLIYTKPKDPFKFKRGNS